MSVAAATKVANASALKTAPDVCDIRNADKPRTVMETEIWRARSTTKPLGI